MSSNACPSRDAATPNTSEKRLPASNVEAGSRPSNDAPSKDRGEFVKRADPRSAAPSHGQIEAIEPDTAKAGLSRTARIKLVLVANIDNIAHSRLDASASRPENIRAWFRMPALFGDQNVFESIRDPGPRQLPSLFAGAAIGNNA